MSAPYTETLIDNIFTNSLSTILQSCTISCGIADHQAVLCITSLLNGSHHVDQLPVMKKFNFSKIDEFNTSISNKLAGFIAIDNPEHACDTLVSTIENEIDHFSSSSTCRRTTPIQPWVTSSILRSINKRNKLLKDFLRNRSAENETKFKKYRNILRLTLRHAKRLYFQKQFRKTMNNPRLLWENLLKAIQKPNVKTKPASRFEINGDLVTDEHLIAESFNSYYNEVAPKLDAALGPSGADPMAHIRDVRVPEMMVFKPVAEQDIITIVMNLKDTGAGPGMISAKLLKLILPTILPQLKHFLNLCITNNVFPSSLKTAVITPVFKGGVRTLLSNYRPISVLPIISKLLETIMYNQLTMFIAEHDLLFENQFGFRAQHSTYMPISILHDYITDNLISNQKTVGIYLDLARAFDTVNTNILLQKLHIYGITGNALELITSYLSNRSQRVKFNNIISGARTVACGVPQGSVLGPLLFLIYINDIHKACADAKFLLFADDTAIFYSAPTKNELQEKIDRSFPMITS